MNNAISKIKWNIKSNHTSRRNISCELNQSNNKKNYDSWEKSNKVQKNIRDYLRFAYRRA